MLHGYYVLRIFPSIDRLRQSTLAYRFYTRNMGYIISLYFYELPWLYISFSNENSWAAYCKEAITSYFSDFHRSHMLLLGERTLARH